MRLSILVPSVHTRYNGQALSIQQSLYGQWQALSATSRDEVEIIVLTDTKSRTIGEKRNDMLRMAHGEYVAFVDDDDTVAPDYIASLLTAIEQGSDVITFVVNVRLNDGPIKPCFYSIDYPGDENFVGNYQRLPNHIMCVKRELALATRFPETQKGEDADYAKRLKPLLKSQTTLNKVLYRYDFNSQTTETQR